MKKKIYIGLGVVLVAIIAFVAYQALSGKNLSPSKTTEISANGLDIKVVYCQPSKRGRTIFGEEKPDVLLPYGKYWRLGANEATEITFSKDIIFGEHPVPAGSYRMYVIPQADLWQVFLNSELGKWGSEMPNHDLDVATLDVSTDTAPETEQFIIQLTADGSIVNMDFIWDTTKVTIPITLQ